jgi:hypothetical protein
MLTPQIQPGPASPFHTGKLILFSIWPLLPRTFLHPDSDRSQPILEGISNEMAALACRFDGWSYSWKHYLSSPSILDGEGSRFRHNSKCLLQAIRLAANLRGGASSLEDVITQSLAASLPPFLQRSFLDDVSGRLKPEVVKHPPSATSIRRNELALDVGLMLLQREASIKCSTSPCFRVGWADSSPIAGYDWIWSEYHEIAHRDVLACFEAVVSLAAATKSFAEHRESVEV